MCNQFVLFFIFAIAIAPVAEAQLHGESVCEKVEHEIIDKATYFTEALLSIENDDNLTPESFKATLNSIIGGHTCYPYNPCTSEAIVELDEDPKNLDNVIGFYSRKSFNKNDVIGEDAWNREHLFPASKFDNDRSMCAYSDLHNLVAADASVSSARGSKDFMSGGSDVPSGPNGEIECARCKVGADSFEPPNKQKGALARMLFYMDVRYEGNDEDFTDPHGMLWTATPDLEVLQSATSGESGKIGIRSELLKWHCGFGVTETEIKRNDRIQSWQGNRNPFIDYPEFVELIWGPCPAETDRAVGMGPLDYIVAFKQVRRDIRLHLFNKALDFFGAEL